MASRYKNSIGKGWHYQSDRHSLASKGIKTGRKSNSCSFKVVGAKSNRDDYNRTKRERFMNMSRYEMAIALEHPITFGLYPEDKNDREILDMIERKMNKSKKLGASAKINFLEKETLTEQEVLLAKRRLNDGKITQEEIFGDEWTPKQLTKEQIQKGKEWLDNLRKTPFGAPRKNNPYGLREEEILDKMDRIELKEFHDASRYGQNSYYIPIYRVYGNEGDYFEYYYDGKINIIG